MKIGYFADGPWSHRAFDEINADDNFEIKFICVRNDSSDEVLAKVCTENDIPHLKHPNVNSEEFISKIIKYDCDILVSMSFNQIFRTEIINLAPMKLINCHAGKLPFYRGRNILNWALINDEKEYGVTVHYVDEGIDTGDIILQNTYPITDEDNYSTLLERAYVDCANTLYNSLVKIRENNATRTVQTTIHPVGMYCGQRKVGDELLNWNQSSRDIFNFVRAICRPGPMATCFAERGFEVKVNKVKEIQDAPVYKGVCGQVIGKTGNGVIVKTNDSFVEVCEYESEKKLRVGDRLKWRK